MTTTPQLALAMIVLDGASHLRGCLESVRGVVDEIVVGDTGSRDDSGAVARRFGARVVEVPWRADFAAARNQVLDQVRAGWVLVLDADERLDPVTRARVRACTEAPWDGYQVEIRNYVRRLDMRLWDQTPVRNDGLLPEAAAFAGWMEHRNVRLFRRDASIRFTSRVHETVGETLLQSGGRLGQADFVIHHLGFPATEAEGRKKHEFYRELGRQKILDRPEDAQAHFELGLEELTRGGGAAVALPYFVQACRLNERFLLGWVFGAVALKMLDQPETAEQFVAAAERLGCSSPLLLETAADLRYQKGDLVAAGAGYERLLASSGGSHPEAASKLGLTRWRERRSAEALAELEEAVRRFPDVAANHDRLIVALVDDGRMEAAEAAARHKLQVTVAQPQTYLRLASLQARRGRWNEVKSTLEAGCRHFPGDASLAQALREGEAELSALKNRQEATGIGESG